MEAMSWGMWQTDRLPGREARALRELHDVDRAFYSRELLLLGFLFFSFSRPFTIIGIIPCFCLSYVLYVMGIGGLLGPPRDGREGRIGFKKVRSSANF